MPRRGENIRKRKDNRWEGRYIKGYAEDGKAKYASVYGKTYFEVKEKLNNAKEQLRRGMPAAMEQNVTFRAVLFLWLQNNRIRLKDQTYAKYLDLIKNHLVPEIGNVQVKRLDATAINQFLNMKKDGGRLDGKGGLSASYIQTLSFIMQAAMEYAAKENLCRPLSGEIQRPAKRVKELEIMTVAEQLILEQHMLCDCNEKKLGVLLSLYTGLRLGEVCGLMWQDIDFENRSIHIRHSVERVANLYAENGKTKTKLILGDVKTVSSNRIIPIPSFFMPLLQSFSLKRSGRFVLPGKSYEYMDPRSYQYQFKRYLKGCRLRSINFHALRHTFATRCIETGMDIKSLSEILGHSSVNITLSTYVHSSLELKRAQLDRMYPIHGQ
ncbi:tyrosine-type recombinase/integrase [Candidatus Soleaferrea massiliensis]|uniref:tyrosine-type recombinase/integrase n=1 Tax=Candidatus Soleaferrea massiliensis TaxID=1470354 RepID=UPI00058EDA67|nr:site-specific integrase [Candidatus Soleaferrea massiliensis]